MSIWSWWDCHILLQFLSWLFPISLQRGTRVVLGENMIMLVPYPSRLWWSPSTPLNLNTTHLHLLYVMFMVIPFIFVWRSQFCIFIYVTLVNMTTFFLWSSCLTLPHHVEILNMHPNHVHCVTFIGVTFIISLILLCLGAPSQNFTSCPMSSLLRWPKSLHWVLPLLRVWLFFTYHY